MEELEKKEEMTVPEGCKLSKRDFIEQLKQNAPEVEEWRISGWLDELSEEDFEAFYTSAEKFGFGSFEDDLPMVAVDFGKYYDTMVTLFNLADLVEQIKCANHGGQKLLVEAGLREVATRLRIYAEGFFSV